MKFLTRYQYDELVRAASVLEEDDRGIKVMRQPEPLGRIIKLFRVKRLMSSALIYPYSFRFRKNAFKLNRINIRAPVVEEIFFCWSIKRHGVIYCPVEGQSLECLIQNIEEKSGQGQISDEVTSNLLEELTQFIAGLHRKGVYCRSLHPGNILLDKRHNFGLIDVADTRFKLRHLSPELRVRNFRHFLRRVEHTRMFSGGGLADFFLAYLNAANLSQAEHSRFLRLANRAFDVQLST